MKPLTSLKLRVITILLVFFLTYDGETAVRKPIISEFLNPSDMLSVVYLLYTKDDYFGQYKPNSNFFADSEYNSSDPTMFIIHGFLSSSDNEWSQRIRKGVHGQMRANIFVVGFQYPKYIQNMNYAVAASNVEKVGKNLAEFILECIHETGANVSQFHLIGHSLGAHIAGVAGRTLQGDKFGNRKLGRISGLDPAGPLFCGEWPKYPHLSKTDSEFVDIIITNGLNHTAGENNSKDDLFDKLGINLNHLGCSLNTGHVNFRPNGGMVQPGTQNVVVQNIKEAFKESPYLNSHSRAIELYIESLEGKCQFKSFPCSSWRNFKKGNCLSCGNGCNVLGFHVNKTVNGTFYLTTKMAPKFCDIGYVLPMTKSRQIPIPSICDQVKCEIKGEFIRLTFDHELIFNTAGMDIVINFKGLWSNTLILKSKSFNRTSVIAFPYNSFDFNLTKDTNNTAITARRVLSKFSVSPGEMKITQLTFTNQEGKRICATSAAVITEKPSLIKLQSCKEEK